MRVRQSLGTLLLVLGLTACQTLPPAPVAPRPARESVERFDLSGRISIRQADRIHQASLTWHHDALRDEILLSGPLGQGAAQLTRDEQQACLTTGDRQIRCADDWRLLAVDVVGVDLPLDGMVRWLLGDVAADRYDEQHRPLHAWVAGWEIAYLEYESPRPDAWPSRIYLRRDDIDVRLKVDQWQP